MLGLKCLSASALILDPKLQVSDPIFAELFKRVPGIKGPSSFIQTAEEK